MGVIFRPTGPRPLSEFTVNIPDPSNKIRNQGLEVLRGWREKSAFDKSNAQELLAALKENEQIESQYRQKAFKAHEADNKRIASLIDKNYDVEIKNLGQEARNAKRKYDALAKLVPAVGEVMIEGDKALDKLAKQAAKKKINAADAPKKESTPETEKLADANTQLSNEVKALADKHGMSPARARAYANITSGRERKWFLAFHHEAQGKQAVTAAISQGGIFHNQSFTFGSKGNERTGNLAEYENWISTHGYKGQRIETAKMWDQKNSVARERYSHVSDENWSKYFRPHFAAQHDAYVNKLQKIADKKAISDNRTEAWQAVGGGYAEGIANKLSPIQALAEVRKKRLENKAPNVSDGDVQRQLTTDVVTGIQARGLPLTVGEKYINLPIVTNDGDKTTIGKKFPQQAEAIRNALKTRMAEETAELEAKNKSIRIAQEAAFQGEIVNLKADIMANPNLNIDEIRARINLNPNIPSEIKNKLQKYTKDNILTVDQMNASLLQEVFERGILNESIFEDDIMEWPIAPSAKNAFIDRLRSRGGDMNNSVRSQYKGFLNEAVRAEHGIKHYGQGGKIHSDWQKKIDQIELKITRAARKHYLDFKGDNISSKAAWEKAYTLAYKEEFQDVWKDRKESGNFWEAMSVTESPGVKRPKNVDPVEQNPVRVIREKVEEDDFTIESFINDGELDNELHMQSEMFKLQTAIKNGTTYNPSHYVKESAKGMGMTPEKFTEIHNQKHNINRKNKIELNWENSAIGQASAALAAASPAVRQLHADQLPSPEATEVIFSYQILTDLGIGYGDIEQLASILNDKGEPELFQRFTSAAAQRILQRRTE